MSLLPMQCGVAQHYFHCCLQSNRAAPAAPTSSSHLSGEKQEKKSSVLSKASLELLLQMPELYSSPNERQNPTAPANPRETLLRSCLSQPHRGGGGVGRALGLSPREGSCGCGQPQATEGMGGHPGAEGGEEPAP